MTQYLIILRKFFIIMLSIIIMRNFLVIMT